MEAKNNMEEENKSQAHWKKCEENWRVLMKKQKQSEIRRNVIPLVYKQFYFGLFFVASALCTASRRTPPCFPVHTFCSHLCFHFISFLLLSSYWGCQSYALPQTNVIFTHHTHIINKHKSIGDIHMCARTAIYKNGVPQGVLLSPNNSRYI